MATTHPSNTSTLNPIAAPGRGWQIFWGVLLIIAGCLAVMMPAIAALANALVFAWVLILAGGGEIVYAFQTRASHGFGWKLASGILTLLLGLAIFILPVAGIASLALLVGAFLLLGGITRTILAWRMRPLRGWGWVMFDGLLSIVVALLIALGWPATSLAIIGLLTGFTLISTGVWRIMLARSTPA
jgi:uncharacterized membrane protein HdeD (DUF308 family)